MEVRIKQAESIDIDGISALFDAYRVFYGQVSNLSLARDFISERLENSESVIFCAVTSEGQYLGFTQLYPSFSSISAQRSWILNDLYVTLESRERGIGKALLTEAKQHAVSTNTKGIALETAKSNLNAQKLYESLGYARDEGYYSYFLSLKTV